MRRSFSRKETASPARAGASLFSSARRRALGSVAFGGRSPRFALAPVPASGLQQRAEGRAANLAQDCLTASLPRHSQKDPPPFARRLERGRATLGRGAGPPPTSRNHSLIKKLANSLAAFPPWPLARWNFEAEAENGRLRETQDKGEHHARGEVPHPTGPARVESVISTACRWSSTTGPG